MRNVKHTPGPWIAVRNSAFWEINPAERNYDDDVFCVGDVCSTAPGDPDGGLQEANARMIAAAPELLDALTAILARTFMTEDESSRSVFDAARAAIAKATGEY